MEKTRGLEVSCLCCGALAGQTHRLGCTRSVSSMKTVFPEDERTVPTSLELKEGLKYDQEGKQEWYAMPLEVLEPLADVFAYGETKYATFNCLLPFKNADRRFYNGQMRHTRATQRNPLALDPEALEKGHKVYELAQIAFNCLMRLYHLRKEEQNGN